MNDGEIIIHGNAGDALGYAMRGGKIFVKGDAGYRTGIHMKEYQTKKPIIIIGGKAGSFLGEYLAGGLIVVLDINAEKSATGGSLAVGNFTGTGMHGGKIFIRANDEQIVKGLPSQVVAEIATMEDLLEITPYICEFSKHFGMDSNALIRERFYVLKPNAKNPYKQLYTAN
jgi:glutamate synthase domain-containing protein 3